MSMTTTLGKQVSQSCLLKFAPEYEAVSPL